ncbi:TPA: hypothetical protein QH137_000155 [Klebsiella aerogenes]|uniref:hypothetical protein n=1 Tax=Klebsiella aerogenes TaxID=548 RepID=UPI000DA111B8|nr:hypothetical protein [Klebsiella aerogenes]MBK0648030.1 hypothetical protein [Klebsiella aerogenes]HCB3100522.1 hypothetical protein [Klebsiella aerogenes]HCH0562697.1 hypothetical protein [Klebsiella aerogenes]HCH0650816.1 hypothetical protein [Klebsiella aerogenes]HCH0734563.1 hypothetical protein [Klebsiella aerogenes]
MNLLNNTHLSAFNYGCDTDMVKEAIYFIPSSEPKYQIFIQQNGRIGTDCIVVAKTIKVGQEATEALALFDTTTE